MKEYQRENYHAKKTNFWKSDGWMNDKKSDAKAYHSKVWRTKGLLKNSDDKSSDSKELLRINLIPKNSTATGLKVKSPATTFSPTQGKTANSLKMKYPTVKSLKMKNPVVKNLLTEYATKKSYWGKIFTDKTPSVKKIYGRKINCGSFKSEGKISNRNKINEEKSGS